MNAMTPKRKRGKKAVTLSVMPTQWDAGAMGQANRHGLQQEPATDIDPATGKDTPNPNNVKRYRRVDMLEVWHRKGEITTSGFNAAEKLRAAYERTQKSPGWPDNDRVQSSPKPDHAVAIQADRLSAFISLYSKVIQADKAIIGHVVLEGRIPSAIKEYRGRGYVKGLQHLREALDRLAARLGC